MKWYFNKVSLF